MRLWRPAATTLAFACLVGSVPAFSEPKGEDPAEPIVWRTYNKEYDGRRFSPLKQINRKNVAGLRRLCALEVGEGGAFEAGPVIVGTTMVVTTPHTTVALNATNCEPLWRHLHRPEEREIMSVNRGVAYLDGVLFRGNNDGTLLALDAKTGAPIWKAKIGDPKVGEFFSSAPIAWRGLVFIGTAGSSFGIRGHVMAFDAKTGKEVWRFWTIPMGDEPGADTWKIPGSAANGGGGMWTSYTLDPTTRELFVPVANPGPDFDPEVRPGDNLYTNSVVVLDAMSGKLKWHYQFTANDALDHDLAAPPVLYEDSRGRRLMAVGSKDGYLYAVDRDTRKLVFKTPVTTVENPNAKPTPEGVRACPGPSGGVLWNGPAFDPQTGLIYVGSVDWCAIFKLKRQEFVPGRSFSGGSIEAAAASSSDVGRGWITAVDGTMGEVRWRFHAEAGVVSGLTPTAGGVVFVGDRGGRFFAFDSRDGRKLYELQNDGELAGGVVTYELGGRQYVAYTSGNFSRNLVRSTVFGLPKIVILALGPAKGEPVFRKVKAEEPELEEARSQVKGAELYSLYCMSCHGAQGEGLDGPQVRDRAARKDPRPLAEIIRKPASSQMPALYPKPLSEEAVNAIATYVDTWFFAGH